MFCYQCEQTAKGKGCDYLGICGKEPAVSDLQDLLVYQLKGISNYAIQARKAGKASKEIGIFLLKGLFTTVTNVNFDEDKMIELIKKAEEIRKIAKNLYQDAKLSGKLPKTAEFVLADSKSEIIEQAETINLQKDIELLGEVKAGLYHLILYGLKGTAAYADHALVLGVEKDEVYSFFEEALDYLSDASHDVDSLLGMALKVGEVNVTVMAMLDQANTTAYGHPTPTAVKTTAIEGKAILVSGHDLKDLYLLLKQTEGKGVNIYTHGEMLPAHGYPGLHKFKHLVGHYGTAWQNQAKEFEAFPGAILMTTNCIQKPRETYKARIFTSGLVQWPGVEHISGTDFGNVIKAALETDGFKATETEKTILVGFGHNAVLSVADKVIDAVKSGAIKHFFLIGGCDGAKPGRNYYTEFAEKAPKDTVILTLACGKFRFNNLEFGDIGGIPRLLDVGQCNDAYSAVVIAQELAKAFDTDINSLPLSLILSWYEQKAVCILLSLLFLGVQNIKLGPSLPAFVKPAVLDVLVEKFKIAPISTVEADIAACLNR